jgi:Tol biopolymer transport system component
VFAVAPLSWSPDGSRLLFWAGDAGAYAGVMWCFWIDLDSRAVKPLPLPQGDPRATHPMQAVWSPDGSAILVAARLLATLPDEAPNPLDPGSTDDTSVALRLIDPSSGESILLGHLPYIPSLPFTAVWGPDGDVLIDGYHLKMARE